MSDRLKEAERYLAKRSLLTQKKEECARNVRNLGVLPDQAFQLYASTNSSKVRWMGSHRSTSSILDRLCSS
jgi:structural maintenance of chromosome 3 (chondroitin sulfate proteoglycan 6)